MSWLCCLQSVHIESTGSFLQDIECKVVEVDFLRQSHTLEPVELGLVVADLVGHGDGAPPAEEAGVGHHGPGGDVYVVPEPVQRHRAAVTAGARDTRDLGHLVAILL